MEDDVGTRPAAGRLGTWLGAELEGVFVSTLKSLRVLRARSPLVSFWPGGLGAYKRLSGAATFVQMNNSLLQRGV
jgi:hypothetical protein